MAAEAGIGGSVKSGAATVANIGDWTLTLSVDVPDTTPFGAAGSYRTKTPTIKDWNGKFSGRLDPADTTGQVALINGLGSSFSFVFAIDATHNWTGNGIVTGLAPKSSATGLNEIDITIDGNGALAYT